MGVTIAKIAERLNLSTATVSRSLAQNSRVHPATRVQVAKVAMELGYQGRSRRQRRPKKADAYHMAVVLQGPGYQGSINAIKLLEGLTAEADGGGVVLHIGLAAPQGAAGEGVRLPPACAGKSGCDLAILLGRHEPTMVAELVRNCPVVSVSTRYPGVPHDLADTADYWGLFDVAGHALGLGHRKLVWVSEASQNTGPFDGVRRAGFTQACLQHGLGLSEVKWLGADAFDGECHLRADAVRRQLDAGTTCFVCATDRVAFEVFDWLRRWGVDVPGRVGVTGFDAVQAYMASAPPRLTSVDPSWVEIGRVAMSLATRRLAQPSAPQMTVTVNHRFVRGETLSPPAQVRPPTTTTTRRGGGKTPGSS